jgi:hypothetical protein
VDAVVDWNVRAHDLIVAGNAGPAAMRRALAVVQTSVYGAVNAITARYPAGGMEPGTARGGSVEAAVASASREALLALLPAGRPAIDAAYQAGIAQVAAGAARDSGIAVGQKSAAAILAIRADDLAAAADATPTPHRTAWLMPDAAALRPVPPPAFSSPSWVRDFNEVRNFGGKTSTRRTAEQSQLVQFWADDSPTPFHSLVLSATRDPAREVTRSARLFMAVAQAADDATIATLDARFAYKFWRPVEAIRKAGEDGNEYTTADVAWSPLSDEATLPEYPCGRCVEAATIGAVLKADLGTDAMPTLQASSRTAPQLTRNWNNVEDMLREVADARVHAGANFRNSTVVGMQMGARIAALAAAQLLVAPPVKESPPPY